MTVASAVELEAEFKTAPVEHFADATLLPGLKDAHAHLTLAGDRRVGAMLRE